MKKLEYTLKNELLKNSKENAIDLFLEQGGTSKCPWHNALSPFLLGMKNLKSYFEQKKEQYFNGQIGYDQLDLEINANSFATAKVCPAIRSVLDTSYLVRTPVDIHLSIHHDRQFYWNLPPRSNIGIDISSHSQEQFVAEGSPLFRNKINIKFSLPIILSTANTPYIYLQPTYHTDAEWEVIPGVISGKNTRLQELNVNTLIDLPNEGTKHMMIRAGTVLAYLWFPEKMKLVEAKGKKQFVPTFKFIGG